MAKSKKEKKKKRMLKMLDEYFGETNESSKQIRAELKRGEKNKRRQYKHLRENVNAD